MVSLVAIMTGIFLPRHLIKQKTKKSQRDLAALAVALDARFVDWSYYLLPDAYIRSGEILLLSIKHDNTADYEEVVKRVYMKKRVRTSASPDYDYLAEHYLRNFEPLTTPIHFIAEVPRDPFAPPENNLYRYGLSPYVEGRGAYWVLAGNGPDRDVDLDVTLFGRDTGRIEYGRPDRTRYFGLDHPLLDYMYDPTNGLTSSGDIIMIRK